MEAKRQGSPAGAVCMYPLPGCRVGWERIIEPGSEGTWKVIQNKGLVFLRFKMKINKKFGTNTKS